jgi:hypothetical protein
MSNFGKDLGKLPNIADNNKNRLNIKFIKN